MKIRTLTFFFDPSLHHLESFLDKLAGIATAAAGELNSAGFELQTVRLATSPFSLLGKPFDRKSLLKYACTIEQAALAHGFTYISIGPALPEVPESYAVIPDILAESSSIFATGLMTGTGQCMVPQAVTACAEIIRRCASITPDGFTNLRFAALGNVPAGAPFFPAAYHQAGTPPACALGMETAADILNVLQTSSSPAEFRSKLLALYEKTAADLSNMLAPLLKAAGIRLAGFDFSTAPYPQDDCSAGAGLEELGGKPLGNSGSLCAAAFLADTLGRGKWAHIGLNGLMLPVLEDLVLAQRAAEGSLTVKDLLLFSSVCGTGLDTVPLPGDVAAETLAALLTDVASLSLRLNKPLTARLMPIPGKQAGDPIHFDFSYFADGAVMALPEAQLSGLLGQGNEYDLKPRE